jgi:hypothetical protein
MATKTTAPAVPAAPTATPPAADTGAGTSAEKSLLDQLTGDDDGPGDLPPAAEEPKDALATGTDLPPTPAAPQDAAPAASDPAHEAYENTFPGRPGFDPETASAAAIEEHIRILKARKKLKALLNPEQPAAPAPAAIAAASAPVPVTIVAAQTPATFAAPSAQLIGKYDTETGLVQQLPQKLWDQLSPEDMKRFSDEPVQPELPASLI